MRSSWIWGVIIVVIGLTLLFNNLGISNINLGDIFSTYWPVLLIFWSIDILTEKQTHKSKGNITIGVIILILGLSILIRNLGYINIDFSILWKIFWPALLILLGINILRGNTHASKSNWAFMSGTERKNQGWKLTDTSHYAFMGGIDLDISVANIPKGETILDLTAIMGGIDVKIPEDITVTCKNTSILGGISFFKDESGGIIINREFNHEGSPESNKKIIIYSTAIMGGIDIKGV